MNASLFNFLRRYRDRFAATEVRRVECWCKSKSECFAAKACLFGPITSAYATGTSPFREPDLEEIP